MEVEEFFSEGNLTRLGYKFLPLLGKYEGWPEGKLEKMFASGEALQLTLAIGTLLQQGVREDEMSEKIASGEVSQFIKQVLQQLNASQAAPEPEDVLLGSIRRGRKLITRLMDTLETHLSTDVEGCAVDLASGSTFFVQNIVRRWPKLRLYPTEQSAQVVPSNVAGITFMRWCLDQFAESPERNFPELAKRRAAIKAGTAEASMNVNLLDSLWFPDSLYPDPAQDVALSSKLRDRASEVDVASDRWADVCFLEGACKLVSCIYVFDELEERPEAWKELLRRAAELLESGGLLLLYDAVQPGGYLDERAMAQFCTEELLSVELSSFDAADTNDAVSKGERGLALYILKKGSTADGPSAETRAALARQAVLALREQGNASFNAKRGRDLQRSISLYTKALDIHSADHFCDPELASRLESNLSAALLEKQRFVEALDAAENAMRWDPDWPKAQFRREKALLALGRQDESVPLRVATDGGQKPQAEAEVKPSSANGTAEFVDASKRLDEPLEKTAPCQAEESDNQPVCEQRENLPEDAKPCDPVDSTGACKSKDTLLGRLSAAALRLCSMCVPG
eukprot:TRINITY_DN108237_c0_g1_i1.p1 TRINITY_DN108237_c0_g1~~TRINITY_DN108237_c0_g1_i1.p1  ORF type:complete len:570 (-),score=122.81 TRINITY_DN108237_c0_g1_i1:66-1775(-)